VSFFEPPPPVEPPPFERPEQEPWLGPPVNELGVAVPLRLVLARTDNVVVALLGAVAYSTGVSFRLAVKRRRGVEQPRDAFFGPLGWMPEQPTPGEGLPDKLLRLGVQFADGRKATTVGNGSAFGGAGEPSGPILVPMDGSGSDREFEAALWLWPLPPAGQLAFVVEWPSEGIVETRLELDAEPFVGAGGESERLWPDEGSAGATESWSTSTILFEPLPNPPDEPRSTPSA
jgi:hypothetical protein